MVKGFRDRGSRVASTSPASGAWGIHLLGAGSQFEFMQNRFWSRLTVDL